LFRRFFVSFLTRSGGKPLFRRTSPVCSGLGVDTFETDLTDHIAKLLKIQESRPERDLLAKLLDPMTFPIQKKWASAASTTMAQKLRVRCHVCILLFFFFFGLVGEFRGFRFYFFLASFFSLCRRSRSWLASER
jgi:hypothetical protein